MLPIFIPDNVKRWFEREVIRFLKEPTLWNNELVPPRRLFLMLGQKGTQMDLVILLLSKGITVEYLTINDSEDYSKFFEEDEKKEFKNHILVIDKVNLLFEYHANLGVKINHLKRLKYQFIICITTEYPNDQYKFWQQFKDRVPMKLPGPEFIKTLLKYRFTKWANHWKYSSVKLTEENYNDLVTYCAYCTSKDINDFTERIFRKIIDEYPTNNLDITMEFIENKYNQFLFTPFRNDDTTYCIVNEDKRIIQHRFDPLNTNNDDELIINNNSSKKRLRTTVTDTTTTTTI